MSSRLVRLLVLGSALACATWPAGAAAEHISITASVGASLQKLKPTSAVVRVLWNAECVGAASGDANYFGRLDLLRPDMGESIYLGGVFGAPGRVDQNVSRTDRDQAFTPVLQISCFEDGSLHGSGTLTASGGQVIVPARARGGGGGGGGGGHGGGNGDGNGGGGPDDPLHAGGCVHEVHGSNGADLLDGGPGGDLILALGGADRVRGRDGHDCLIGGAGRDRLLGEDGDDRLTGGRGGDRLDGGAGRNAYDAGSGADRVLARNGRAETVRCGPGKDTARADRSDRLRGYERISAGG